MRLDQSRGPQLETEPNNDQAGANELSLKITSGNYQARMAGALGESDAAGDYYRLGILNIGNAVSVNLLLPNGSSLTAGEATLSVELAGSSAPLATNNTGLLNYTATTDGVHYVRIQAPPSADYALNTS